MEIQQTSKAVFGDAANLSAQTAAATSTKQSQSSRGNKENPGASPLKQKGSNKKLNRGCSDENSYVPESSPFGSVNASAFGSNEKLSTMPQKNQTNQSTASQLGGPKVQKQLFGDATASLTNINNALPKVDVPLRAALKEKQKSNDQSDCMKDDITVSNNENNLESNAQQMQTSDSQPTLDFKNGPIETASNDIQTQKQAYQDDQKEQDN